MGPASTMRYSPNAACSTTSAAFYQTLSLQFPIRQNTCRQREISPATILNSRPATSDIPSMMNVRRPVIPAKSCFLQTIPSSMKKPIFNDFLPRKSKSPLQNQIKSLKTFLKPLNPLNLMKKLSEITVRRSISLTAAGCTSRQSECRQIHASGFASAINPSVLAQCCSRGETFQAIGSSFSSSFNLFTICLAPIVSAYFINPPRQRGNP